MNDATVISPDGTELSYFRKGTGPALVITHGSIADKSDWFPVIDRLADNFTCFVYDRRGRGGSIDTAEYSMSAEIADIKTMMELAGADAHLLGHSYGALCTLEYALRNSLGNGRLVLFEPPLPVDGPVAGDALPKYKDAIESGDPDAALGISLKEIVRVSDAEIAGLRQSPVWPRLCELAPTWTRELVEIDALGDDFSRFNVLETANVSVIRGTATSPMLFESATEVVDAVPGSRLYEIPEADHFAHLMVPDTFSENLKQALGD
ncbi:alpha/beta hydrolase [Corynebacterium suranareeae]|uniref:Alpha/beta hydrolase n=1 Tax=Corynebacterium suranareeae TaxID=2506452 RepID=A0A160PPE5_9CORY|nr:alpha/beta hydrolase [Corynebacterium suranareeae]BAU94481.1 alpha/beta hydrolase [Corynebacterium suranareeae]